MIKSVSKYISVFIIITAISYLIQSKVVDYNQTSLQFNLLHVYLFFSVISLLICVLIKVLSTINAFKTYIGFVYLFTVFFKIMVFAAIFYGTDFNTIEWLRIEKLHLIIPMFIFLFLEVGVIAKILNGINILPASQNTNF